jgi:hypothetical protein
MDRIARRQAFTSSWMQARLLWRRACIVQPLLEASGVDTIFTPFRCCAHQAVGQQVDRMPLEPLGQHPRERLPFVT